MPTSDRPNVARQRPRPISVDLIRSLVARPDRILLTNLAETRYRVGPRDQWDPVLRYGRWPVIDTAQALQLLTDAVNACWLGVRAAADFDGNLLDGLLTKLLGNLDVQHPDDSGEIADELACGFCGESIAEVNGSLYSYVKAGIGHLAACDAIDDFAAGKGDPELLTPRTAGDQDGDAR